MTDGVTVIRFLNVNEEKTERTMTLKFKLDVAADVATGEHVVKVEAVAAEGTEDGEEFINDKITCTSGKITVEENTPACEHENTEYVYSIVEGNCVTKRVCSNCENEEIVATIANKTITPNMVVASGLAVRYRVKKNVVTDYTNIYALISKDTYDNKTNAYIGESTPVNIAAVAQGSNWQFEYTGIASYEMTCTIHVKVFGSDVNGNVLLLASSDSAFADYLKTRLASTGTYSDAYMDFYSDALRYGAASQKFNGYRTDALATDGVTTTYGSTLPTAFENTTTSSWGSVTITPNTVLSNSVMFRIRFAQSAVSSYYTAGTLKMTIDYTDASNKAAQAVAYASDFTSASNGRNWQYEFSELPAAFIGDYFTVKLWDGETMIASLQYCFQNYAADKYSNYNGSSNEYYANLSTLCQATVAYSASLKTALVG